MKIKQALREKMEKRCVAKIDCGSSESERKKFRESSIRQMAIVFQLLVITIKANQMTDITQKSTDVIIAEIHF